MTVTVKLPDDLGARLDAIRLDDEPRNALVTRLLESTLDDPPPGGPSPHPRPLMEVLGKEPAAAPEVPVAGYEPTSGHRRHVAVLVAFNGRAEQCSCGAVRAGTGPWSP